MSKFSSNWQVEMGYVPYYRVYSGVTTKAGYIDNYDTALLIAAAPEMYTLLSKLLYHGNLEEWAVDEIEKLIARIDGEEEITAHEETN